jgi:LPS sulfotransferase NodH
MRSVGKSLRFLLTYLNPLNLFEQGFIKNKKKKKVAPPIFIVGAPRSGTTLLYQLLTYHFEFSYFSNFTSMFIKSPVLMGYLTRKIKEPYDDNSFSSDYGLMKGTWAPSEAGKIFKYWFLRKNDDRIKNSIYALSEVFEAPFIAKNLRINAELEYIHQMFPDALFIHIKRETVFNAQSLILGIQENKSDLVGNIIDNKQRKTITEGSKEQIYEQVVDDINTMNNSIASFLNSAEVNMVTINYNELCNDYESELKKIESKLKENNGELQRKNASFNLSVKASQKIKLSNEDWKLLQQIIEKN